jgi:CBS domain-containing protein
VAVLEHNKERYLVTPTDDPDDAIGLMRASALRRVPGVETGRAIGIVSLGDLAGEVVPARCWARSALRRH